MRASKRLAAAACIMALFAAAPHYAHRALGSFAIALSRGPFVPGSRIPLTVNGASGPVSFSVLGPGSIEAGALWLPPLTRASTTTIIAAAQGAIAYKAIDIVPPPGKKRALLAVATYEGGIALHDPATFALIGFAATGGPPGDVAFTAGGDLLAPDTDGTTLTRFERSPWLARAIDGVAFGNEIAVDRRTGAAFVTNRDVNGKGALTRILTNGRIDRTFTGETAEGLAIDSGRGLVYAGNVNDGTVAEIDARTMALVRHIRSLPRTFGIALDTRVQRLFVVSNATASMHRGGGYVAAIDLRRAGAPIIRSSARMSFPLGVAFEPARERLFVTDEAADIVYVLNAVTLRALRAPLATCRTPWRPRIAAGRLYVPCARANAVDVFDLRTLRRAARAPFATGGFPLDVALWP